MPKIYDNQKVSLLAGLEDALKRSDKSDICTAYFNLRGWKKLASIINEYKPEQGNKCRLLLGMYGADKEFRKELTEGGAEEIDRTRAQKLKAEVVKNFKKQLEFGIPDNIDERGLRQLVKQLKDKKVQIKCFTRYPLHAKLYLTFNDKDFAKKIGFLGSSNLTFAGLERQGELNIDVLDQELCEHLGQWFEDKWNDRYCLDISDEIINIIEQSWAGNPYLPYHIYIKMAYHLSEEARRGLTDFFMPKDLKDILFDFQSSAVRIATYYVSQRNGVLIGDVVGLGKTFVATAIAKILEEENGWQTLILCPKNLEEMWDSYIQEWGLRGRVIPTSLVKKLDKLKRHHLVIIDESHNFRNPQGKRYRIVKDYIEQNDSKCVLLSATPYNKTYQDLSSQLGLFINKDDDIGVQPTKFLQEDGGQFYGVKSSLKAFEQSNHPEDWQQLMSQFLIRRTRSFIKKNYGNQNKDGRFYITDQKGNKKFFPDRTPITIKYDIDDQYRKLFSEKVVDTINELKLPRYDLNRYKKNNLSDLSESGLSEREKKIFKDLERSRAQPKGFCRINLFKRLESSGFAFLMSIQRHILRNCIFIYAIKNGKDLIIKESSSDIIADAFDDQDGDITGSLDSLNEQDGDITGSLDSLNEQDGEYIFIEYDKYYKKAELKYNDYRNKKNAKWIKSSYFSNKLVEDLQKDTKNLLNILKESSKWNPEKDLKLKKLIDLLKKDEFKKSIIFSQSKETAKYLYEQLSKSSLEKVGLIFGGMNNIQDAIHSFSPVSNNKKISPQDEINILVATDVLSEGQNLQDCNTVINYDLPWAIIKLIQRVGRIDRIGQKSENIFCYSFLPDEGLDKLINLKLRIKNRLKQNAEVIGTDELFFQDEEQVLVDLYNEKSGVLDREALEDIDLPSYALEIWNKAIKDDPEIEEKIKNMPNSVHASKKSNDEEDKILLFAKSHINNNLLEIDQSNNIVNENQKDILDKATCEPNTPCENKMNNHYDMIKFGVNKIEEGLRSTHDVGRLGSNRSPRKKAYDLFEKMKNENEEYKRIFEEIYEYPLLSDAEHTLARMFRRKVSEKELLEYIQERARSETLVNKKESKKINEKPSIICSLGLIK